MAVNCRLEDAGLDNGQQRVLALPGFTAGHASSPTLLQIAVEEVAIFRISHRFAGALVAEALEPLVLFTS